MDRIARLRRELLDDVAALPPEAREARPIPGKWSVLEIVEHLVLTEEDVAADLASDEEIRPRRWKHRLLRPVVMFVLRFGIPVKVPSRAWVPTGRSDLGELAERWERAQATVRRTIEVREATELARPVTRHPVAGPMTVKEALAMLEVHLRRHARQIDGRIGALPTDG